MRQNKHSKKKIIIWKSYKYAIISHNCSLIVNVFSNLGIMKAVDLHLKFSPADKNELAREIGLSCRDLEADRPDEDNTTTFALSFIIRMSEMVIRWERSSC